MSFFSKLFRSSRSSSPAAPEKSAESFAVETVETPVENPVLSALLADFAQADDQRKPELFEKIAEEIAMNARLLLVIRPFQGKRFEAHPKDKILYSWSPAHHGILPEQPSLYRRMWLLG